MMIIKSILLLIATTILIVKGQDGNMYFNVIPYTDSECTNNVGYGVSGLIYSCFTLDYVHNWVFTPSGDNKEATVTGYINNNETELCGSDASLAFPTRTYMLDSCVSGNLLPQFNVFIGSVQPSTTPAYYKLTLTQAKPAVPSNTYTRLSTYAQCFSDNFKENTVAVEYFTNGTVFDYGTDDETFMAYCNDQGIAESITCLISNCETPSVDNEYCGIVGPFFNSSDSSSSGNSGVSGGSASASSSGFQININGDKNNNNMFTQSSTGSGSVSSSNSQSSSSQQPTGYYQTIYCTPK